MEAGAGPVHSRRRQTGAGGFKPSRIGATCPPGSAEFGAHACVLLLRWASSTAETSVQLSIDGRSHLDGGGATGYWLRDSLLKGLFSSNSSGDHCQKLQFNAA
jgi:hypothetical protein